MKKITSRRLFLYLFIAFASFSVTSCKKTKDNSGSGTTVNGQLSDADSLKYLMYNIMQTSFVDNGRDTTDFLPTYYWYTSVPKLNPFSSSYDSADVLLAQMKTYAINPTTGGPYDRYSFLDHGEVAAEIQQGVSGDLGMQVTYASDASGNTYLYVLFADPNSPSGKVGVTRGWQITAINGNTNISYDGSNGANVNMVINAVYNSASASFTFIKPDGTTATYTLTSAVYDIDPVLFDTIYNVGAKKVGYFVFNSFSSVDNDGTNVTRTELNRVFSSFENAGINSLIVDLRYNGGGAVETAEYIDSLIAPASVAGKEMYHYLYNNILTANEAEVGLQSQVLFTAGGSLNLDHVFFVTSRNTVSASELTINNLKPYMDVKLVGDTTFGKPVGFFSFHITDFPNGGAEQALADLYAINFETKNANNQGGYFTGIVPDAEAVDYVDLPWGNPNDDNLVKIFNYISTGTYGRMSVSERMTSNKNLRLSMPSTIVPLRFTGMVDYHISSALKNVIEKSLRRAK
jgi:carboxyl-terminal processing protease